MNQLAHIFISYIVLNLILPNAKEYFLPIALFSCILDIDHIPSFIKYFLMPKKTRVKLSMKDHMKLFRSAIQEPIGIITIEAILGLLYLLGVKHILLIIAAVVFLLHWIVDFFTVHTRPLIPFSNLVVGFFPEKEQRIKSEIIITVISLIIFLIVYF
jgi:hypothetical protein